MVRELQPIDISTIPELAQLADEVERTQRSRRLRRGSRDVAVLVPASEPESEPALPLVFTTAKRRKGSTTLLEAINAGYQSVPALDPPRSLQEMTDIAAAEHAERIARSGR